MRDTLLALVVLALVGPLDGWGQRNFLIVIADDLGTDASNAYRQGDQMPNTPTLDSLQDIGLTFDNAWATPVCTPTRAAILSGKIGAKTGVNGVPGTLDTVHTSLFRNLNRYTGDAYAKGVFGKWHVKQPTDANHPFDHGVDHFEGLLTGGVMDYFSWRKTSNGSNSNSTEYITSEITDDAVEWVAQQSQPWLLWMAHVAPHTPLHVPPADLHSRTDTDTDLGQYLAMIESMDAEIGRLIASLSPAQRANTTVLYFGDNGTSNGTLRDYPRRRGKGTLYQGGVRVPFIVAGPDVTRRGEREQALVHVLDVHATVLALAGVELPGGIHNSLSFDHLLRGEAGPTRRYNYNEVGGTNNADGYTMRDAQYKLIVFNDGTRELYDLQQDSLERRNLLTTTPGPASDTIAARLDAEATVWRNGWSCTDHIQNGDEQGIDCGGSACAPCAVSTTELADTPLRIVQRGEQLVVSLPDQTLKEVQLISLSGQVLHTMREESTLHFTIDVSALAQQGVIVKARSNGQSYTRSIFLH